MSLPSTTDESLWLSSAARSARRNPLATDAEVDVVVVGGGITGALTTLLLARDGARVMLLEARRIAGGVTGNTTAKVTALHGDRYRTLSRRHGEQAARDYATAQLAGLELVRTVVDSEGIECDLAPVSAWSYAVTPQGAERLLDELEATQAAGLDVVDDPGIELSFGVSAAIRLDDQVKLQPVSFVDGVVDAAERRGALVHEDTRVVALHERGGLRVETESGHVVRAGQVVVATHYPLFDRAGLFARVSVHREFALSAEAGDHSVPGMIYGVEQGTLSVRAAGDQLVFTGCGFRPGSDDASRHLGELEKRISEDFPGLGPVQHRWAAQDVQAHDMLPYVGRMLPWNEHVHVATGFAGWGLSNGAAAATALSGRISGAPPEWSTRFDPQRLVKPTGVPAMAKEQATVAAHFVADRVRPRPQTVDDLAPGEGAVLPLDGAKRAVFRDDDGEVRVMSARCTHLGCLVSFNDAEREWQCPCHGSRFDLEGCVLSGPASRPLAPYDKGDEDDTEHEDE